MGPTEGFVKLREEILNQALPLLDSDTLPAEDRFRFSLQVAQLKGSIESYRKAFSIAQKIQGDDRLLAYLDLLSDVDYVLQEGIANRNTQEEVKPSAQIDQVAESRQESISQ